MSLMDSATTFLCSVLGSWSSVLLLFVVLLATWMYYSNPARHSPPGPTYIPLIGSLPFLFGPDFDGKVFMEMSREYKSPIVSMRMCGMLMTAINDYDMIKEIFAKRTDVVDRNAYQTGIFDCIENFEKRVAGIVTVSGPEWKFQRRFTLQMMRDFGMGRLSGEDKVIFEASEAMNAFKHHNGQPFDPRHIIMMAAANITNQFIYGKRFSFTDKNFQASLHCLDEFAKLMGSPISFFFLYRLGRRLFKSKFEFLCEMYRGLTSQVIVEIEEHKLRFDGTVNDMIDAYLAKMENSKDDKDFTSNTLENMIRDLFMAGSETSSNALRWAMLEMAIHQDIQEKVYLELVNVLGPDNNPTMSTKKDTPYTEAVLCEIQRNHTLTELGMPHGNISNDIEISGYIIPKGTLISGNLFAVHNDPMFWKKPGQFYPENFLDEQGYVANTERLIQFSVGRRSCAGEALARTQLYILFATWMKNLHIKLETDDTVPDLRSIGNFVKQANPFSVRINNRL